MGDMAVTTALMVPPVCYPLWRKGQRLCKRCGGPLSGRRRAYCSDECRKVYWVNHYWGDARIECIERAGRYCQGCGKTGAEARRRVIAGSGLVAHHVIHLKGDRAESCYNHQANLVCLCTECHGKRHTKPKDPTPLPLFDIRPYTIKVREKEEHQLGMVA